MSDSWIKLHNGKKVDVVDVELNTFTIDDFIKPLSQINRYTGNTRQPYSVGEHSVKGSLLSQVIDAQLARAFLIHDVSEAIMSDIPSPIKRLLPQYVELEERFQKHIFRCFNEPWESMDRLSWFDKNMCQDEMMVVFDEPEDIGRTSLGNTVDFWSPETTQLHFLNRAQELGLA